MILGAFLTDILADDRWKTLISLVQKIIFILQIAAPLLLIILGMVDFLKATMASNEADIDKAKKRFINRIISAVIVLLLLSIFQFVFGLIGGNGWLGSWGL